MQAGEDELWGFTVADGGRILAPAGLVGVVLGMLQACLYRHVAAGGPWASQVGSSEVLRSFMRSSSMTMMHAVYSLAMH